MKKLISTFLILFSVSKVQAYYSTMDTGEILKKGQYRLSTETLVGFNDLPGLNLIARGDVGFNDSSNFRIVAGAGAVGFQSGLLYKWVPIPDYEDQPAIGIMGGFIYARNEGVNYLSMRVHPLVSKEFKTDSGRWVPYASLPFGITTAKKTTFPLQLAVGTEWQPESLERLSFMSELGLSLNESYSYFSLAARLWFDDEGGISFK